MVAAPELFEAWANLLHYPQGEDSALLTERIEMIRAARPELGDELVGLADYAASHSESELEEVFTRTFDSNAERALEVGWHLHGENYARGVFMVRMRKLLRDAGVEETCELPDHISHVLRVLARSEPKVAKALANGVVSPALAKIADGFGDNGNPYLGVITSLKRFIDMQSSASDDNVSEQEVNNHE